MRIFSGLGKVLERFRRGLENVWRSFGEVFKKRLIRGPGPGKKSRSLGKAQRGPKKGKETQKTRKDKDETFGRG